MKMIPVVLAGGSGERLWPLSSALSPKQCLALPPAGRTLLHATLDRIAEMSSLSDPRIVCGWQQRFAVGELLSHSAYPSELLVEPHSRGTAVAVGLSAMAAREREPDAILAIFPADHHFSADLTFAQCLERARRRALSGDIVALGIPPRPGSVKTQLGYIQPRCFGPDSQIKAFHEKPSLTQATDYSARGEYYWNSGIYIATAKTVLTLLQQHQPNVYRALEKTYAQRRSGPDYVWFESNALDAVESLSIDHAIVEPSHRAAVVRWNATDWSDLGSWAALYELSPKDGHSNVRLCGQAVLDSTSRCLVANTEARPVALSGVHDLVVVNAEQGVLVMNRQIADSQEASTLLKRMACEADAASDDNR